MVTSEEFRNLLRLKLDWGQRKPDKEAEMGLLYVQKGIRWIPAYKFVIDGKGGVSVQLEATLINELADLEDVTANLVVGVPSFAFADTADPMGMGQTVAQLSSYFQKDTQTQYAFSNSIMSQVAGRMGERVDRGQPESRDLGPEIGGSEKNEDLFVYTLRHVTLKKGQRMVVPVASFDLKYQRRLHRRYRLHAAPRGLAVFQQSAAGRDRQALSGPQGHAQDPPDQHEQVPHHHGPDVDPQRRPGAGAGHVDLHLQWAAASICPSRRRWTSW